MDGYSHFGAGAADVTTDAAGNTIGGVRLDIFDAEAGGVQVTDLLDDAGNTLPGYVTSSTDATNNGANLGRIRFQAPAAYSVLYGDRGYGDRYVLTARESLTQIGAAITKAEDAIVESGEAKTASTQALALSETAAGDADEALGRVLELTQGQAGLPALVDLDPSGWFLHYGPACTIPTPDGTGQVVHPSILFFAQGFGGYRYWLAFTPYASLDAEVENPCIVASNDGYTFEVPPGVTNPLVPSPPGSEYNSDVDLAAGPNGEFALVYRTCGTQAEPTDDVISVITSTDMLTWSDPVELLRVDQTVQRILSPAVWWDGQAWQMIAVGEDAAAPSPRRLLRWTAAEVTGTWAALPDATVSPAWPAGRDPWHIEARCVGGQVLALVNDNPSGTAQLGELYLLVSSDNGATFTRGAAVTSGLGGEDRRYRSTLVPVLTGSGVALEVWDGTLDTIHRSPLTRDSGWHTVGDPGEPAFLNGYTHQNAATDPVQFRRVDNKLRHRGRAKLGANGTSIFTLPERYRPPVINFDLIAYSGVAGSRIQVDAAGGVTVLGAAGATSISLTGLPPIALD